MDYMFAVMGTALMFFMYKTVILKKQLKKSMSLIIDIALKKVTVEANHKTKEIKITYKDEE